MSAASDVVIEFDTHPLEGVVMTTSASLMLLAGYALAGFSDAAMASRAEALLRAFEGVPVSAYAGRRHFVFLGGAVNTAWPWKAR